MLEKRRVFTCLASYGAIFVMSDGTCELQPACIAHVSWVVPSVDCLRRSQRIFNPFCSSVYLVHENVTAQGTHFIKKTLILPHLSAYEPSSKRRSLFLLRIVCTTLRQYVLTWAIASALSRGLWGQKKGARMCNNKFCPITLIHRIGATSHGQSGKANNSAQVLSMFLGSPFSCLSWPAERMRLLFAISVYLVYQNRPASINRHVAKDVEIHVVKFQWKFGLSSWNENILHLNFADRL